MGSCRDLLAFVLLAGCRQVFGLEPPRPLEDAAGDGAPAVVTGQVLAHVVSNDGSGAPTTVDMAGVLDSQSARLDDGTLAPITFNNDGTFAFALAHAGQGYRIGSQRIEIQTTASHLTLSQPRLCRADARPVTQSTQITYALNDSASTSSVVFLAATGCWTLTQPAETDPTHFTVDWQQVNSLVGPALLDGGENDLLYYLRLDRLGGGSQGQSYALGRYRVDSITLQDGVAVAIGGTSQPPPMSRCVRIMGDEVAEVGRIQAAGYMAGQPVSSWDVSMLSVPDLSPIRTMFLAEGTPPANVDSNMMLNVGIPAPGTLMIDLTTELFDSTQPAGPQQVTAATAYFMQAPTTCTAPSIGSRIALPTAFTINGAPIAGAAPMAVSASSELTLSWTYTGGTADVASVEVVDATTSGVIASYLTDGTSIAIPPGTLQARSSYFFIVEPTLGVPGASHGDFATLSYPRAMAIVHTPTVTAN